MRPAIVPRGIPGAFFGALQSSHRAFRAVHSRLSPAGRFTVPGFAGLYQRRGSYGSRAPALFLVLAFGLADVAAASRAAALVRRGIPFDHHRGAKKISVLKPFCIPARGAWSTSTSRYSSRSICNDGVWLGTSERTNTEHRCRSNARVRSASRLRWCCVALRRPARAQAFQIVRRKRC
jgi:hypothetical protein